MSYVDRLLAPGEAVIHRTLRHWVVLLRWIGSAVVLAVLGAAMASAYGFAGWTGASIGAWIGVGMVAVAVVVALPAILRWITEVYLVTDRRVIRVAGVLHKQALDSGLAKVNDVRLTQTMAGRLLGYGTLEIITASESGINRLEYLPRPMAFKKAMMAAAAQADGGGTAAVQASGGAAPGPAPPAHLGDASPVPRSPAAAAAAPARSPADRLADLEEMRRRGLLTDDEYRAKRAQILAGV
jgi:hypothetical protein